MEAVAPLPPESFEEHRPSSRGNDRGTTLPPMQGAEPQSEGKSQLQVRHLRPNAHPRTGRNTNRRLVRD